MSSFTDQLWQFAERLKKDGYPTALVERCAERQEQLEAEIVRLHKELAVYKSLENVAELSNN